MSVERTLRIQARGVVQAGKVPNRLPDRIWGGPGAGTPCTVCGAPVKPDEAELEVEWSEGASTSNHHFHARCFAAVEHEIREREPTQPTLAASGQLESAIATFPANEPPTALA